MARNLRWEICSAGCAIKALHLLITIFCSVIYYFLLGTFPPSCGEVPFYFASSLSSFASSPSFSSSFSELSNKKLRRFSENVHRFLEKVRRFRKNLRRFFENLRHFFVFPPKIPFSSGNIVNFGIFFLEKHVFFLGQLLYNSYFCNYRFLTFSLWLLQEWKNYIISHLLSCEDFVYSTLLSSA